MECGTSATKDDHLVIYSVIQRKSVTYYRLVESMFMGTCSFQHNIFITVLSEFTGITSMEQCIGGSFIY